MNAPKSLPKSGSDPLSLSPNAARKSPRGLPRQRAIFDRRTIAETIAKLVEAHGSQARQPIVQTLRNALEKGRLEPAQRLAEKPSAGHECTAGHAFLTDQLLRVIYDHVTNDVHPAPNRTAAERLALLAVGGYGRSEMAPHSDIDIAFITPTRRAPWCEQVIESMLYLLWDLGLKVGHSSRTVNDTIKMAKEDLTIRTALLEARLVWGDQSIYEETRTRFWRDVARGTERDFLNQKLAERTERHKRMGDRRYVVEPNVKEGKGGLRDLQTLYWIGKYIYRAETASELVSVGLLTRSEYRSFRRAESFLLAVRCHMHELAGRAEDRLTFDLQRQVAERMSFADRPGKSAVERFMQFYFLQAKRVGNLTAVFLDALEEEFRKSRRQSVFFRKKASESREVSGFLISDGAIRAPRDDWFERDPVRLIEVFQIAEVEGVEVHPQTMRLADQNA